MLILTPSDCSLAPADGPTTEVTWVRSGDGRYAQEHGSCAASLLPVEAEVVLALPVRALSWHRLAVPKVAASRLRAVLDGLLEERVLGDTADLHFALEPGGRAGQTVWVAVCQKAWLQSWLTALESAGRPVSRIVPTLWPTSAGRNGPDETVHWAHDEGDRVWLATANPLGVRCIPLRESGSSTFGASSFGASTFGDSSFGGGGPDASVTDHLLDGSDPSSTHWFADPSITALAEQVCNQRFDLMPPHDWLLRCTQSEWNLAQFDLSLSSGTRRSQRLRQSWRQFRAAPAWRPARWGLIALLASQLIGLNVAAWQERSSLQAKRQAVRQTLQQTFPNVTLVLDPSLQMQRELAQLQQVGGQLSGRDLEAMLTALGGAGATTTPQRLNYSPGELRLEAPEEQLRMQAQALGTGLWNAQLEGNTLRLQPQTP